jgi:Cu(I)/Ag(I) efflux system membrane fusion protein
MKPTVAAVAVAAALAAGIAIGLLAARRGEPPAPAPAERRVLYWYDPMVPDKHFEQPGRSPFMDMDLVPKYAGEDAADGVVAIDPRIVQNLGVRTARAERGALTATVRATALVAFDERAVADVTARVAGIVERLHVRAPRSVVAQGQPLATLIAPEWTAAQAEYLSLRRANAPGLDALRDAARTRLTLIGMSETDIRALERRGVAPARVTIVAPRAGVVADLAVREGASVAADAPLLRISGLDTVWIDAAIAQTDAGRFAPGAPVQIDVAALRGATLAGSVDALLPDVDAATRTRTARIVLANPDRRLAPGMVAQVRIAATASPDAVIVPTEAVIATGTRYVVIVALGDGRFRAQEVRVGDEADGRTAVLAGLADGEEVVRSGQFLIDSEASLAGVLARLDGAQVSP